MPEPRKTRNAPRRQEPGSSGQPNPTGHRQELIFWSVFGTLVVAAVGLTVWATRTAEVPGDLALMEAAERIRSLPLDYVMLALTDLGLEPQIVVVTVLVSVCFWLLSLRAAAILALLTLAGDLFGTGLKAFLARPRPPEEFLHAVAPRTDFGFPSGHALHAILLYGFIAFIIWYHVKNPWWRLGAVAALAIVIVLTGVSRVYLGAHWPSDVAGGYLIGAVFLMALARLYAWLARAGERARPPLS